MLLLQRMKDPEDDDIEDVIEDNVLLQKALILQEIYFRKVCVTFTGKNGLFSLFKIVSNQCMFSIGQASSPFPLFR